MKTYCIVEVQWIWDGKKADWRLERNWSGSK